MNSGPRLHRRTLIAPTALLVSVFSSSTVLAAKESAEGAKNTNKLPELELSLNDSKPALATHQLLGKPYHAHRLATGERPQASHSLVDGQLDQAMELQMQQQPPPQPPPAEPPARERPPTAQPPAQQQPPQAQPPAQQQPPQAQPPAQQPPAQQQPPAAGEQPPAAQPPQAQPPQAQPPQAQPPAGQQPADPFAEPGGAGAAPPAGAQPPPVDEGSTSAQAPVEGMPPIEGEGGVVVDPLQDPLADPLGGGPLAAEEFTEEAPFMEDDEEVIQVTIDRRAKDIQDLSAAAEVYGGETLERRNVQSLRDLPAVTPYVEIGAQEGNLEIFIRGVGNTNNTEIGDPAAAFHLDGVYIPRPRGLGAAYYDIDRVEISRGPQGTLRGRNATAGTLNIVSNAPQLGEWAASGSFQYGNYQQRVGKAMVNIPVGDRLAFRFAAYSEVRESYYENKLGNPEITPGENADTVSYRAQMRWAISDNVTLTIRHDNTFEKGTGVTGSNYTAALRDGILPEEIPDPRAVAFIHQPRQELQHLGVSANLVADLGPLGIEFSTSYRDLDSFQSTGHQEGVYYYGKTVETLDQRNTTVFITNSDSFVNELRLFSPDDSRFRWTVGGFHFYESQYAFFGQVQDNSWGWGGQEFNHPDMTNGSYAGYADGTFDIVETFRALAGIRVTHEHKERTGIHLPFQASCAEGTEDTCSWGEHRFGTEGFRFAGESRSDFEASANPDPRNVDEFLAGIGTFGERDTLDDLLQQEGAQIGPMAPQVGSRTDTFVDFRVGLEYDISPLNFAYLTFSTGHKSGGFNDSAQVGEVRIAPEFGPEAVYSTELGSKNAFLDKRLVVNAAAFWYNYQDYQANSVEAYAGPEDSPEDAPKVSVRRNVGGARVLGLEADILAYLPQGFKLSSSLMLLDARFGDAVVADTRMGWDPSQQPDVNLDGNFLPRAPQFAISYGIEQNIPTGIGYFDWSLSGQTKSKRYMTQFNGDGYDWDGNVNPLFSDVIPWTHRFDAAVGYTRPQGDIRIDAFIANIGNMAYATSLINAPGLNLRFINPPRTMGVRLSMYL